MSTTTGPGADRLAGPLGGGNASGRATRERLVLTAERLFAERGIAAVSLREVGAAAGQRNNGATQYHFGDRDGLIRAIVNYRSAAHRVHRDELLDAIETPFTADDVRAVVAALVEPLVVDMQCGSRYVGFIAHVLTERGHVNGEGGHTDSGRDRAAELLRECLPDLPAPVFATRLRMVTMWMVHALADRERHEDHALPMDQFVDDLITQLTAVMRAPAA